jgi:RecA-family ATPase
MTTPDITPRLDNQQAITAARTGVHTQTPKNTSSIGAPKKKPPIPVPKPSVIPSQLPPPFHPQSVSEFLDRQFPPKEPLIEGILYRRDLISLTGRRRNGKTTLLHNLAVAGALGREDFLGFKIPRSFRTASFYLEDDGGEMQEKIRRMVKGAKTDNFHLYTRTDFMEWRIPITVEDARFKQRVIEACTAHKPDLIVLDNLGMLISAKYNDAKEIQVLMDFVYGLAQAFNAAVLIAAHPRKGSSVDKIGGGGITLVGDPEKFFEETMGSSHFVNSTGSLWGIERTGDHTDLLLGTQRYNGTQTFTVVEKNDDEWFERASDLKAAERSVINTVTRQKAWELFPSDRQFSYVEARELVKGVMRSSSTFYHWWRELVRLQLVKEAEEKDRYTKIKLPSEEEQEKREKEKAQKQSGGGGGK